MRTRGDFVLDASVTLAWCFEDEAGGYADAVLDSLVFAVAMAPAIWPLEVVNVLAVAERRGRIDEAGTSRFVNLIARLLIVVEWDPPQLVFTEVLRLAREYELSAYDASYLSMAMRYGVPLVTMDAKLEAAAREVGTPRYLD